MQIKEILSVSQFYYV